jgi:hypothetical protein
MYRFTKPEACANCTQGDCTEMAHFMKRIFGQGSQPGGGPPGGGNSSQRTVDAIQNLGEVGFFTFHWTGTLGSAHNSVLRYL